VRSNEQVLATSSEIQHPAETEFIKLIQELMAELEVIKEKGKTKLPPAERRLFIRSSFATIEAMIFVMKQIAVVVHPDPDCQMLTQADKAFAHEQEFKLTNTGDVEIRPAKIPLEANVQFAFKLLAKSTSTSSVLDVAGHQWQAFQGAIKLRDRITHRKKLSDLPVSDEELTGASSAFHWLLTSFIKMRTEILKAQSEPIDVPQQ
jgi:hypothetical protein